MKGFDGEYRIDQFIKLLWNTRKWKRIYESDDYLTVRTDKYILKLIRQTCPHFNSPSYTRSFFNHFHEWRKQYAPPFSLTGKTVLDVGCGCGETPMMFFEMGASKVICVDMNPYSCLTLKQNAESNGWYVNIINESFNERHLKLDWDFAKIDCEGGEAFLLDQSFLTKNRRPIVLETHNALITYGLLNQGFTTYQVLNRENGAITHAIIRNYNGVKK